MFTCEACGFVGQEAFNNTFTILMSHILFDVGYHGKSLPSVLHHLDQVSKSYNSRDTLHHARRLLHSLPASLLHLLYHSKEHNLLQIVPSQCVSEETELPRAHHSYQPLISINFKTHPLFTLTVNGIRSMPLRSHVSAAPNGLLNFLSCVQASLPCSKTDRTKHSNSLSRILKTVSIFVNTLFTFPTLLSAIPILLITSLSLRLS